MMHLPPVIKDTYKFPQQEEGCYPKCEVILFSKNARPSPTASKIFSRSHKQAPLNAEEGDKHIEIKLFTLQERNEMAYTLHTQGMCICLNKTHVKTPASTSSIQLGTPLCRPFTGPGVHERSSYHLIPEFRGARAQWNFTDHLVKPNSFKAPPHLPYISLTHLWPVCGSREAGEEHHHQGVLWTISRSETFTFILAV